MRICGGEGRRVEEIRADAEEMTDTRLNGVEMKRETHHLLRALITLKGSVLICTCFYHHFTIDLYCEPPSLILSLILYIPLSPLPCLIISPSHLLPKSLLCPRM